MESGLVKSVEVLRYSGLGDMLLLQEKISKIHENSGYAICRIRMLFWLINSGVCLSAKQNYSKF